MSTYNENTTQGKNFVIVYHANCADGWFAAYITHLRLVHDQAAEVSFVEMSPGQPNTYPHSMELANRHVWLVDVSVDADLREQWMEWGALSIHCIDHHETAHSHWPADASPIHVESCAALQAFRYFFDHEEVPAWLCALDRIDRWDHPTHEDRCLREEFLRLSHLPAKGYEHAIQETAAFFRIMEVETEYAALLAAGAKTLQEKDDALKEKLRMGQLVCIGDRLLSLWKLPVSWMGKFVFILNNTGVVIDSTEAAHLVFENVPEADVYVNYRICTFTSAHHAKGRKETREMVKYNLRSRAFDITEGTLFKGHPMSAGYSTLIPPNNVPYELPFVLPPPTAAPVAAASAMEQSTPNRKHVPKKQGKPYPTHRTTSPAAAADVTMADASKPKKKYNTYHQQRQTNAMKM